MQYEYFINLDERGEFHADVRNPTGDTVFEMEGAEIFEEGFMRHKDDLTGLHQYMVDMGVMQQTDTLIRGN